MGTAHKGYISEYITATGSTESIKPAGVVTISIVNHTSFVGTIQLQRKAPGATAFYVVEDGSWTDTSLPITKQVIESHPDTQLKLVCTAYTSGTALASITSSVMGD